MKLAKLMMATTVALSLAACGGGGGGGSSSSTDTGTNTDDTSSKNLLDPAAGTRYDPTVPGNGGGDAVYVYEGGSYQEAQLTEVNRPYFTDLFVQALLENYDMGQAFSRSSSDPGNRVIEESKENGINKFEEAVIKEAEQLYLPRSAQAKAYNTTVNCDNGGFLTLSGNLENNTNEGVLDIDYTECRLGSVSINGNAKLLIKKMDLSYNKFVEYEFQYTQMLYTDLNTNTYYYYTGARNVNKSYVVGKLVQFVVKANIQRINYSSHRQSYDGTTYQYDISTDQLAGTICDNDHGCAVVSTTLPLNINQGEVKIMGANNSSIRISISNGAFYAYVDAEGDGNYKNGVQIYP